MAKAIETSYGGYAFRSRLEARWAVFFDTVGIVWRYEPNGFFVGDGWEPPTASDRRYLPDFYLPEQRLWVEVRGALDVDGLIRLCEAACPHSGLPGDPDGGPVIGSYGPDDVSRAGLRMLVLSDPPGDTDAPRAVHQGLRFWKGEVCTETVQFHPGAVVPLEGDTGITVWDDMGVVNSRQVLTDDVIDRVARPWRYQHGPDVDPLVELAYGAARRARFEYGQTPS